MPDRRVGDDSVSWLFEHGGREFVQTLREAFTVDSRVSFLIFILVCCAVLVDSLFAFMQRARRRTGITRGMIVKSVEGGSFVEGKEFRSERLGLVGRPDAVVEEKGYLIPVERKTFGKRPRDKDTAQLLVYCRLIEAVSGHRPPHGYVIMGPQAKRFKVVNSEEKQRWIDAVLGDMRSALAGGVYVATPNRRKCEHCSVRERCTKKS